MSIRYDDPEVTKLRGMLVTLREEKAKLEAELKSQKYFNYRTRCDEAEAEVLRLTAELRALRRTIFTARALSGEDRRILQSPRPPRPGEKIDASCHHPPEPGGGEGMR